MATARYAREATIEKKVVAAAFRIYGVRSLKLTLKYDTGWPDRLFLIPGGRPLFIEMKRPGGEVSKKQEYQIGVLKDLGYAAEIIDNYEDALRAIARECERASSATSTLGAE